MNRGYGLGFVIGILVFLFVVYAAYDLWLVFSHQVNFDQHIVGFFPVIFGVGALILWRIDRRQRILDEREDALLLRQVKADSCLNPRHTSRADTDIG